MGIRERRAKRKAGRAAKQVGKDLKKWLKKDGGFEAMQKALEDAKVKKPELLKASKGGSIRAKLSSGGPVGKAN